jgi:hypothetical protein
MMANRMMKKGFADMEKAMKLYKQGKLELPESNDKFHVRDEANIIEKSYIE